MKQQLVLGLLLVSLNLAFAGYNIKTKIAYNGALDSSCTYDDDCMVRNSYCKSNRICACKLKFKYDARNDMCSPTELGLKCIDDSDCPFDRSQCIDQLCQCEYNHVASEFSPNCLPSSRLQASCQDDQQCRVSDSNSHCNTTTRLCDCVQGYHTDWDTQQCTPNKRIRDMCDNHGSCANTPEQQSAVECRPDTDGRRKCLCRTDYTEQNNACVRGLGGGASQAIVSTTAMIICVTFLAITKF